MNVDWFVNDIPGGDSVVGTITAEGVYTAPNLVPDPEEVTIKAVSLYRPTKSDTAVATIKIQVKILTPSGVSMMLNAGESIDLSAQVIGSSNQDVIWFVNGIEGGNSGIGLITPDGLYSAPNTIQYPTTVRIEAISQADGTSRGEILLTLIPNRMLFILDGYGNVYQEEGIEPTPTP